MAPIVHGLEEIYTGDINFVYLDIDDPATNDFKKYFGYRVQPEYYLIDQNGEVIHTWFGQVPPEVFMTTFDQAILE
jgi:hypothetical protein